MGLFMSSYTCRVKVVRPREAARYCCPRRNGERFQRPALSLDFADLPTISNGNADGIQPIRPFIHITWTWKLQLHINEATMVKPACKKGGDAQCVSQSTDRAAYVWSRQDVSYRKGLGRCDLVGSAGGKVEFLLKDPKNARTIPGKAPNIGSRVDNLQSSQRRRPCHTSTRLKPASSRCSLINWQMMCLSSTLEAENALKLVLATMRLKKS